MLTRHNLDDKDLANNVGFCKIIFTYYENIFIVSLPPIFLFMIGDLFVTVGLVIYLLDENILFQLCL